MDKIILENKKPKTLQDEQIKIWVLKSKLREVDIDQNGDKEIDKCWNWNCQKPISLLYALNYRYLSRRCYECYSKNGFKDIIEVTKSKKNE